MLNVDSGMGMVELKKKMLTKCRGGGGWDGFLWREVNVTEIFENKLFDGSLILIYFYLYYTIFINIVSLWWTPNASERQGAHNEC